MKAYEKKLEAEGYGQDKYCYTPCSEEIGEKEKARRKGI